LCGGGDIALDGQMGEIVSDFGYAHFVWMSRFMKSHIVMNHTEVGLLGMVAVVLEAQDFSHLVVKFLGCRY